MTWKANRTYEMREGASAGGGESLRRRGYESCRGLFAATCARHPELLLRQCQGGRWDSSGALGAPSSVGPPSRNNPFWGLVRRASASSGARQVVPATKPLTRTLTKAPATRVFRPAGPYKRATGTRRCRGAAGPCKSREAECQTPPALIPIEEQRDPCLPGAHPG